MPAAPNCVRRFAYQSQKRKLRTVSPSLTLLALIGLSLRNLDARGPAGKGHDLAAGEQPQTGRHEVLSRFCEVDIVERARRPFDEPINVEFG